MASSIPLSPDEKAKVVERWALSAGCFVSLSGAAFVGWAIFGKQATPVSRVAKGITGATLICTGPVITIAICMADFFANRNEILINGGGPGEWYGMMPGGEHVAIPHREVVKRDGRQFWTDEHGRTWELVND